MTMPLSNLDGRSFMWAGDILMSRLGNGFFFYVGPDWRGPFPSLFACEIAASAAA